MNTLSALPLWQWLLLGGVATGIVLLYFLKLKRQPLTVPSTYLWSRTIEDIHVNSLLQRLRRSLLLFLQLFVVGLAALALLRPGWQSSDQRDRRLIFLLDTSASMRATDVPDAPSRFEVARGLIRERIDRMHETDVAMLIAFNDRAEVLQSFTSDRNRLREALRAAQPTNRPTNILDALRAAAGLANPNRARDADSTLEAPVATAKPADLLIFSDGGFGDVPEFDLQNLRAMYVPVGTEDAANVGIIAFHAQRNPEAPEQIEAFARVVNTGKQAVELDATLSLDGRFQDAVALQLDPQQEVGLPFQLTSVDAMELKLVLEVNDASGKPRIRDDLAIDNVAHAAIAPLRTISVLLVSPGNRPLELALQTEQTGKLCRVETVTPDYLGSKAYAKRVVEGMDELIIFDRCQPDRMPACNTVMIGSVPPTGWQREALQTPLFLIDIDRTHPLMRFLELYTLQIVQGHPLQGPPGGLDLLASDQGPVMILAPRDGYQDLVLGFEILSQTPDGMVFNSDWPVQRSWPVFVLNLLRHLGGAIDSDAAPSYRPGETVVLRVDNRFQQLELQTPAGGRVPTAVEPGGNVPIIDTEATGLYQLTADGQTLAAFTINLFDQQESNIAMAAVRSIGSGGPIGSQDATDAAIDGSSQVAARGELWRLLLLLAVVCLSAEWIYYTRRLA